MAIKALVIDLDGTLYSSDKVDQVDKACIPRTHSYLKKRGLLVKISKNRLNQIDKDMESGKVSSSIRKLSKSFNINYKNFNDYVNDLQPNDFGINTDKKLISLISKAAKRYKIFIFTNAPKIWTKRAIEAVGLSHLIPIKNMVYTENMGTYLKPDKEAYRIMLKITKTKEEEIIFIDDKAKNIVAGNKIGINSIKVHNSDRNKRNSIYSILEQIMK